MAKHSIVIWFDREFDRDYFTGQMSDGHGENFCDFRRVKDNEYHCSFFDDEFYPHAINMDIKYGTKHEQELAKEAEKALTDTREGE